MASNSTSSESMSFLQALRQQRWDDHRYYHHSRINQTLHLISSLCFISSYILIFFNLVAALLLGWIGGMVSRQIGHFFFEPKDYDHINNATHKYKESIKVGYNLHRKVILFSVWGLVSLALYLDPTFFGFFTPEPDGSGYLEHLCILWLVVAAAALLARTIYLCAKWDVQSGLVWFVKILTDPFSDVKQYCKSPLYLLKGELLDPMHEWPGMKATGGR